MAETCVFVKQSLEPCHCDPRKARRCSLPLPGHPFSQSYGVSLPSSLTRVLSRAWVSSTRLPVSVCGTVGRSLARGFSGRPLPRFWVRCHPSPYPRAVCWVQPVRRICLSDQTLPGPRTSSPGRQASGRVPPLLITETAGAGISTGQPSPTPFGFGLGPTNLKRTNLP